MKCRRIVENLQREWFGQKLCNCRYWQLQVEQPYEFSSVIHPAQDQSQCQTLPDSSVLRLHICVERTIAFSLGDGIFDIQSLLHSNIVINRFRSDSSLPPGDSHLLDVGLTSPTCRFPPDLFLRLGRRKRGVHPDAVAPSPRARPWERG